MNRDQRRAQKKKKKAKGGHPARSRMPYAARRAAEQQRRLNPQTDRDKQIEEIVAHMRAFLRASPEEDGIVAGPLMVAASYAARAIVAEHDLNDESDEPAVAQWLLGLLGGVISGFQPGDYRAWREDCRARHTAARDLDA